MSIVEVIAMTPDDAKRVEESGADRIELVAAFAEGGLTPDYGVIENVVRSVKIPVNVMIRPHSKSFVYTPEEIAKMKEDILFAKEAGANGVVFGTLNAQNKICRRRAKRLIASCGGLEITFHRAVDELSDIVGGVKTLSDYPEITNVLTSGGKGEITGNIPVIKELLKNSGHIHIMAGGGLNLENAARIKAETGAEQFHFGTAARRGKSCLGEIDAQKLKELVRLCKQNG